MRKRHFEAVLRTAGLSWLLGVGACLSPSPILGDLTAGSRGSDDGLESDGSTAPSLTDSTTEGIGSDPSTGDPELDGTGSDSAGTTGTTGPVPNPGDPFEMAPALDRLSDAQVTNLFDQVDQLLDAPAVNFVEPGLLIIDHATGQVLYENNADTPLVPASNTKLFSTAAALDTLGPDHQPHTEVWAQTPIPVDGILRGPLHIIDFHDFSRSEDFYPSPRTSLELIAEDLYAAGLREVQGGIIAQGESLYDGDPSGTYSPTPYRIRTGTRFREALETTGIAVMLGNTESSDFAPPPGGTMLAHWEGKSLAASTVAINSDSHDEFADVLVRHVGWLLAGVSDYITAAAEVINWYGNDLGLDSNGMIVADGSGQSSDNRFSARQVIDLLRTMSTRSSGDAWRRTFSIAGFRGTLQGRLLDSNTERRVHGQSSTQSGMVATSGIIYNRWDGREYLFSILMNNTGSPLNTQSIHDQIIEVFAANIRKETPPPAAPVLRAVQFEPETSLVHIEWDPIPQAEGYLVWLSPDGLQWDRSDARYVTTTEHRAGSLPFAAGSLFVRVSAVGPTNESAPSDTYSTRTEYSERRVLIVDGNDRWQADPQSENVLIRGHDFAVPHAHALQSTDVGWDSVANELIEHDRVSLGDYRALVWILGEEGSEHDTFSAAEQVTVTEYLDDGGALFVSGSEIGWDLEQAGDPIDQTFLAEILHAQYLGDNANTYLAQGQGAFSELGDWSFYTPGTLDIRFPDILAPGSDAQVVATYVRGTGGSAALLYEGPGAVFLLGFPFETIDNATDRAQLMERALERLLLD